MLEVLGDARIRLYRNETNIGPGANFVRAYARARGKYVAALCDDDIWKPEYLARLVPALEQDCDLVVAFSDHDIIDENGTVDEKATEQFTRRWRRTTLHRGTFAHSQR